MGGLKPQPLRRALVVTVMVALVAASGVGSSDGGSPSCGSEYKAGVTRSLPQTKKSGFGVVFVANHGDPEQHKHFLQNAVEAAQSYARVSPRVPRALITNAREGALPGACRSGETSACVPTRTTVWLCVTQPLSASR